MDKFIEINEKSIKFYMKKWRDVPPGSIGDKITMALEMGIPIEYLVSQNIITPDKINSFNADKETLDKILEYMSVTGKIESKEELDVDVPVEKPIEKIDIDKSTDGTSSVDTSSRGELRDTIFKLEDDIKGLQEQLEKTLSQKETVENEKNRLMSENKNLSSEITEYSKNIEILHEEIEKSYEDSGVSSDQIDISKKERIKLQTDIKIANEKISNLSKKLSDTEEALSSEKDKTYELEMDIDRVSRALELKTKDLSVKIEELKKLRENNIDLKSKMSMVEEKNISLEIQLDNLKSNSSNDGYVNEISKLNKEIENLKIILSEKNTEIDDYKYKVDNYKREVADLEEDHDRVVKNINRTHEMKLEEYRKMLSSQDVSQTVATRVESTEENSVDITRARVEGKKIVSLMGSDVLNIESIVGKNDKIFIAHNVDDADLHVLITDLTKGSIEEFKKNNKEYKDSIKILVNWVDELPFSIKSITGTEMDIVVRNASDKFKDTWLERKSGSTWKNDITRMIESRLGVL